MAHIAFSVEDVNKCLEKVLSYGGSKWGEVVIKEFPGLGTITFVYAKDPEGNILEIQKWNK